MGFPMVQVFLIAARQVSKPIADSVIRYGKNHPLFRSKLLIPLGRGISRFTSRLRMKGLGLNMQVSQAPISEAAALEEASDFVQQLVLFSYSVGVFAGYYFYTKMTTPESLKMEEYQEFKEQQERALKELRLQIESLEQRLAAQQRRNFFSQLGFAKDSNESPKPTQTTSESTSSENPPEEKSGSKRAPDTLKQRFQRISSLPIDAAASLILDDEEYLVVRRGSSVGIELSANFAARGERLRYRIPLFNFRESTFQSALKQASSHIIGAREIHRISYTSS